MWSVFDYTAGIVAGTPEDSSGLRRCDDTGEPDKLVVEDTFCPYRDFERSYHQTLMIDLILDDVESWGIWSSIEFSQELSFVSVRGKFALVG